MNVTRQEYNQVLAFLRRGHENRQLKAPAVRPSQRGIRSLISSIRLDRSTNGIYRKTDVQVAE